MKFQTNARRRAVIAGAALGAAMTLTSSAMASDCTSAGAGAGGTCAGVTITTLYIESGVTGTNGNVYIAVDGAMTPLGCSLNGGYVTLPRTAPTFNATYASLLAVQSTKAPFNLRVVQGDGGYCVVAYLILH